MTPKVRLTPRLIGVFTLTVCATVAWIAAPDIRLLLVFPLVAFAPGAALDLVLTRSDSGRSRVAWLAIWPALSVSAIAIVYLWAAVLHVSLAPAVVQLLIAGCCGVAIWRLVRRTASPAPLLPALWMVVLTGSVIVACIVQTRFAQIAPLVFPAWVDSLHHALLIRVAIEQGHAPLDLAPYLPVTNLPYHSGYHSFSAVMLVVAGAPVPDALNRAMLVHGQLLNVLAAIVVAGAAYVFWRHWVASLVALIVVGMLSIMPAYYVSWGRYTLLAGVVLLPGLLILLQGVVRSPSLRAVLAAAIALTGMSLVHFVLFVYALVWCLVAVCVTARQDLKSAAWRVMQVLALSFALQLPWALLLAAQAQPGSGVSAMHVVGNSSYNAMPYGLLWTSNNPLLAALAGCSALALLVRRRRMAVQIVAWSFVVVLASNLPSIGLPYISFLTNEVVAVTLFLPVALLISGGAALLAGRLAIGAQIPATWRTYIVAVLLVAAAGWFAYQFQTVIRSDTIFATADDMQAIAWAREHTPPDARFVVNTAGWLADVDRGADGGWWLLPLAGRQVSTPPVVYTYASAADVARIKRDTAWLRTAGNLEAAQLAAFMRREGYRFAYATAAQPTINVERLRASPLFAERYRNPGVSIFELVR